jgi:hypothetical protein
MNGSFWVTIGLIVAGGTIGLIGSIVQFAAWIRGLFNSYLLPRKAWFLVVLVGRCTGGGPLLASSCWRPVQRRSA